MKEFVLDSKPAYRNPLLPAEERVRDLLSRMTIDEKCAQLGKLRGFNTITLPGEDKRRVEANRAFSVLIRK
jgi:hypothetical protein